MSHEVPSIDDAARLQSEIEAGCAPPLLLDFKAPWCGTCRLFAPVIGRVAARYEGALRVVAVDVDALPEVAEQWDVRGLPTLVLIKGQQEVLRINRLQSEAALTASLAPHLDATAATTHRGDN
jgi:thioredoxin 1